MVGIQLVFLGYYYHFNGSFEKQKFLPWSFITILSISDVAHPLTIDRGKTIFENYGKKKFLRSVSDLTKLWWAW